MAGLAALVLSAMAVFLLGVKSQQRVCYFGPPPEPDPDNPGDWMKQAMREIRKRCPGRGQPTPAAGRCLSPKPLGLEDRTIPDDRMTASSSQSGLVAADGRLNNPSAYWLTFDPEGSWIEVDLQDPTLVSGVITQGSTFNSLCVTQYRVSYQSSHSSSYAHVQDDEGNTKVFNGNSRDDPRTPVTNHFSRDITATTVRIEPTDWYDHIALRLELLGCRLQ